MREEEHLRQKLRRETACEPGPSTLRIAEEGREGDVGGEFRTGGRGWNQPLLGFALAPVKMVLSKGNLINFILQQNSSGLGHGEIGLEEMDGAECLGKRRLWSELR